MTLNEDRDRQGQPRYDFPEADMPFIRTGRGVVFLPGASKLTAPGETVDQVSGSPLSDKDNDGILDAPNGPDTDAKGASADGDGSGEQAEQVKTELAAYRRWARKNPDPKRPFEFQAVTKTDAPDLAGQPVIFATPGAVTGSPKGEAVAWPGWDRDQVTAEVWAARIRRSMANAVGCDQVAERWLAQELVKADEPDASTSGQYPQPEDDAGAEWAVALAVAFLAAQGITLTAPISAAITEIWAEGWAIGAASAHSLLDGTPPHFGWTIGDDTAARQRLTASMADGLQAFLDRFRSRIPAIANRRLRVFARVLVDAKSRGMTARELAEALRDALHDDSWARMTALTELSRATAQAARQAYTEAGITAWAWVTEPGACPVCATNEAAGPRAIGQAWPDGSDAPPAHPNCRCVPVPA